MKEGKTVTQQQEHRAQGRRSFFYTIFRGLLNLVATRGHVGIRFYKDFDFGNERVTSPWHMGYIERNEGCQSPAILRDWRFTAALWDEDGNLVVGSPDDPQGIILHDALGGSAYALKVTNGQLTLAPA